MYKEVKNPGGRLDLKLLTVKSLRLRFNNIFFKICLEVHEVPLDSLPQCVPCWTFQVSAGDFLSSIEGETWKYF